MCVYYDVVTSADRAKNGSSTRLWYWVEDPLLWTPCSLKFFYYDKFLSHEEIFFLEILKYLNSSLIFPMTEEEMERYCKELTVFLPSRKRRNDIGEFAFTDQGN